MPPPHTPTQNSTQKNQEKCLRKILVTPHITNKELIKTNKQRKSIKKWAKDMNWHYIGTKIYMKKGLKSFIRNMQIKTTLRYNFHLKDGQKSRNSVASS